jgi:ABC-type sugar transport system permease subunit
LFLLAAAAVSGLPNYAFLALAGTVPAAPSISMYLAASGALLCYSAGKFCQAEAWRQQVLHTVLAIVAIAAASAMLVKGLMILVALSTNPGAHHLAFVRTLIICAAALSLAYCGAHWRRMELTRIGYATLVLVAAKLVFEDLRHGHLEFIAASIFLFAVTLIAVPRFARMGKRV